MRDIIFRAKDHLEGRWQYGAFGNRNGHATIYTGNGLKFPVHGDTVGQYTGLEDRNGERIFEGDIVLWRRTESSGIPVRQTAAVFFEEGCFVIKMIDHFYKNGFAPNGISLYAQYEMFDEAIRDYPQGNFKYEVIGNMHDNPELLDRE